MQTHARVCGGNKKERLYSKILVRKLTFKSYRTRVTEPTKVNFVC